MSRAVETVCQPPLRAAARRGVALGSVWDGSGPSEPPAARSTKNRTTQSRPVLASFSRSCDLVGADTSARVRRAPTRRTGSSSNGSYRTTNVAIQGSAAQAERVAAQARAPLHPPALPTLRTCTDAP